MSQIRQINKRRFLVVYKRLKDHNKLKNIYTTWDKYRTNYLNAKLAQMKKNKIGLYDDKGIPTKMHIMW